jgi:hypothetical protein
MFAYIRDGQLVKVSNEDNVEWDGLTIPHVSLLTQEERRAAGIYDFVHADQAPAYHRAGATTYVIDDVAGTVTEVVELIPLDKAAVAAARKVELAAYRYNKETGGIVVGGAEIKTDRESQSQLNGAYTSLKNSLIPDTPWKAAGGVWVPVTLMELEPIATAVAAHVRACFKAERSHAEAMDAIVADPNGTVDDLAAYDYTTGWPA